MNHPESKEQIKVVTWLKYQYSKALFTASVQEHAGGKFAFSNIQKAARRKRMGYRAGTPDIAIYEPKGVKHGLFVEMKAVTGGVVSPDQKAFLAELESRGYATLVCHGFEEAQKGITEYLREENTNGTGK